MQVTVWGARGSIPVSGPEYVRYGGDTTCLEVRGPGEPLLIDAGTGIRRAGNRLHAERVRRMHLLFTHAHWDHVLGFPFFRPLYSAGRAHRDLRLPRGAGLGPRACSADDERARLPRRPRATSPPNSSSTSRAASASRPAGSP